MWSGVACRPSWKGRLPGTCHGHTQDATGPTAPPPQHRQQQCLAVPRGRAGPGAFMEEWGAAPEPWSFCSQQSSLEGRASCSLPGRGQGRRGPGLVGNHCPWPSLSIRLRARPRSSPGMNLRPDQGRGRIPLPSPATPGATQGLSRSGRPWTRAGQEALLTQEDSFLGRGPEGDHPGGRRRPTVPQEQLGRTPGHPHRGPHLPSAPQTWALAAPAPCLGVDSSNGTCILWLLEDSIQWEPLKVTGGPRRVVPPPAGGTPRPGQLMAQAHPVAPPSGQGQPGRINHRIKSCSWEPCSPVRPAAPSVLQPGLRRVVGSQELGSQGSPRAGSGAREPGVRQPSASHPGKPGEAVLPWGPPSGSRLPPTPFPLVVENEPGAALKRGC